MASTRRAGRKGRMTRRGRGRDRGVVSVEGLRASFDKIDAKARSAIEAGQPDGAVADAIRKAWVEHFHQDLSITALKGLVIHYRSLYRTRKTRKQRGGMAPLDWTMGQGTTAPVCGSFPVEIGSTARTVAALDHDRYFENSASSACDGTGYPPPKQVGGGIFDALFNGHAMTSVPPNMLEKGANNVMGAPHHYPSGAPEARAWQFTHPTPTPFNPSGLSNISTLGPVYQH
jgi:hypothetical protein